MVHGSKEHAEALREEAAGVLAPLGLRLSAAKTRVCHLDEGLDFLGFRIQRRLKRGTARKHIYTYPSKKALASITGKVRALTRGSRHRTLADLLRQVNAVLRMVQLLPVRRVKSHVPLCGYVHVAAYHVVAAQTAQGNQLEDSLPAFPYREGGHASRGESGDVPAAYGRSNTLSVARLSYPRTMGEHSGESSRLAKGTCGEPDAQ